jgi:type II restriction enzyme
MNSLIGSKNIEEDFENILEKYPEVIRCIPILLAVRLRDIKNNFEIMDEGKISRYDFTFVRNTPEEYNFFMRKSGLFNLISNRLVNNLVDYVTGVETGLDSNGRKNRGGKKMEQLVETFILETGHNYRKEVRIDEIEKVFDLDLSSLSNSGKTVKRFDFVVESEGHIYGIEVNFYSGGGSKLNETARSYKMLAEESKDINNFTFVWITDGPGWKSARNNLEETFDVLKTMYSIKDLENGVLYELFGQEK